MTSPQGTATLVELAAKLSETAPHVRQGYDLKLGSILMQQAAAALLRVAHLDPDIQTIQCEN